MVVRAENRDLLKRSGVVVWLTGDADTLWSRIDGDTTTASRRPTLTVGGRDEVAELIAAREPWYRDCANLTINTTGRTPAEIVAQMRGRITAEGREGR